MRTRQSLTILIILMFFIACGQVTPPHTASMSNFLIQIGPTPSAPAMRLDGGFIQYNNAVTELKSKQWQALIREMYEESKMDTVIIQRLGFRDGNEKYILSTPSIDPENPKYMPSMKLSPDDPTLSILTYADSTQKSQRPMKVFIGLWMEDKNQWSYDMPYRKTPAELEQYLNQATEKNKRWADLAWNLYHEHPSFRGWYIPHEYWNFPYGDPSQSQTKNEKQEKLRNFLKGVSEKCKALNEMDKKAGKAVDRPVAFAPFFNPWQFPPWAGSDITEEVFTAILEGSGVDILMLQDGSGARCLDNEKLDSEEINKKRQEIKRTTVPEFFYAFAAACQANNIRLWADLEIFKTSPSGCRGGQPEAREPFQTSTVDQLKWQFTVSSRDPVTNRLYDRPLFERFIGFDIYHYMNSVIPDNFGAATSRAERTAFFNSYKREFVDKEFKP